MSAVLTAAQMRAIEQAAIESGKVTGLELMERAGAGVVEAVFEQWPELAGESHRAVVLCGPGNNGGDGFVIARLLKNAGWEVQIACTTKLAHLKGDAATNARRVTDQTSVMPYHSDHLTNALGASGRILVVDALLGTGQDRNTDAILEPLLTALDEVSNFSPDNEIRCVSVDVPTGYDTDNGALLCQNPFEPELTVSFHTRKPVHQVLEAQGYEIVVKDIGL